MIRKRKDCVELEKVLIAANDWAVNRQMKFNVDKSKMVCTGRYSPSFAYEVMGSELTITTLEQALGVMIASSISTSAQCLAALRKANQMRGMEYKPENIGLPSV